MKDTDEEKQTLRSDWLSHPYTQQWAEKAPVLEAKMRSALIQACGESTDPKVIAALAAWKEAATFANWLKTGDRR